MGDDSDESDNEEDAKEKKESEALEYGDKDVESLVNTLRTHLKSNSNADDLFEEMRMHQLANLFDNKLRLYITLEVVCDSNLDAKSVIENKKYISKMISKGDMSTADVLWAFNAYVHANPDSLKVFAPVLKALYDEDWAEEKEILEYYDDDSQEGEPGFEEAKKAAGPFLKWLQVAEADDDDSDEEEDDDDE